MEFNTPFKITLSIYYWGLDQFKVKMDQSWSTIRSGKTEIISKVIRFHQHEDLDQIRNEANDKIYRTYSDLKIKMLPILYPKQINKAKWDDSCLCHVA